MRGGSDPRDADVRALRKQLAELHRKTSARPEARAANADSSSPSASEHSGVHGHDRRKMGPSHPASILLRTQLEEAKKERDGAMPLLEKIQAAEKRLKTQQNSTAKRDQLQHSLQAVQEKLQEALTLRLEQEAELMDLRAQLTCHWQRPRWSQDDHGSCGCALKRRSGATSGAHAR